jgi:diadenylate cyclase
MQQSFSELFSSITATNVADILIMAVLVYSVAAWLKGTRAFQILASLVVMVMLYYACSRLGLVLTSLLFQYLWAAIIVVLVIVFQPEIREMLDRVSPIRYLSGHKVDGVKTELLDETVKAVAELASQRLGALIVFKRVDALGNLMTKGKPLGTLLSSEAIIMIFQKRSPLHDGAIFVVGDRIQSAGCILPLSKSEDLDTYYGTRHRAALGLTERSDALCVVVSEERGEVSLVERNQITNYRKRGDFQQALERGLALGQTNHDSRSVGPASLLLANWRLKILCLLISIALWLVVVGPQRAELGLSVPIQYTNLPPEMEITGTWTDRVDARVKGSEASINNMKPGSVRVVLDLNSVVTGLNYFRITPKNVSVPPGITISEVRPSDLQLSIEAASLKKIAVVPTLVGPLPEKVKVSCSPAEVQVKAVQDELKKIKSVTTEPVTVAELEAKGKVVVPVLIKPDGLKIESTDPVQVTITLEAEKT